MEFVKAKLKTEDESLKLIADYLIKHCEKEPTFSKKILDEKKDLEKMWDYIYERARSAASGAKRIAIAREVVYGWAVHYFDEENVEEEYTTKTVIDNKEQPKTKYEKATSAIKEETQPTQLTLF